MDSTTRVKSVQFEMGNFLRITKTPQRVVITPAAKSIDSWMRDVTASIQVTDDPQHLIDARQSLVEAQNNLEKRDLTGFINSVKSAHNHLADGQKSEPEKELPYNRKRSIKSLLY